MTTKNTRVRRSADVQSDGGAKRLVKVEEEQASSGEMLGRSWLSVCILRILTLFLHDGFSVACEVMLERFDILVKTKGTHGPENVVAVDSLALLALALVGGLGSNEANELGHAFLDGILPILGDFGISRQCLLHDACDVRRRQVLVLLAHGGISLLGWLIFRHGCGGSCVRTSRRRCRFRVLCFACAAARWWGGWGRGGGGNGEWDGLVPEGVGGGEDNDDSSEGSAPHSLRGM